VQSTSVTAVIEALADLKRYFREQQQQMSSPWGLVLLEQLGPSRVSALAQAAGLDASSVSRHLAGLEAEGFVNRADDPADGRAHLVELTDAGRAHLAELRGRLGVQMAERLAMWDDDELEQFAASLRRFAGDLACRIPPSTQKATA
jgi:DNA-binding MarR family transcriptional regulator